MESDTFFREADDAVEDVYYQRNQLSNRRYKTTTRSNRGRRGGRSYGRGVSKRHKNPIDSHGNISRYRICESINHWEDNCPDNPYGKSKGNTGVVLYQSMLHTQKSLQQVTGETLSAAVLDSGATSTVCRKMWIDCYKETLSDEDRLKVTKEASSTNFKFGDGRKIASIEKANIPAMISEQPVRIRTDIVREEIPLLLSKKSTNKAETNIDF